MTTAERSFILGALVGAATAALVVLIVHSWPPATASQPTVPPKGGEREGDFELFVGS